MDLVEDVGNCAVVVGGVGRKLMNRPIMLSSD